MSGDDEPSAVDMAAMGIDEFEATVRSYAIKRAESRRYRASLKRARALILAGLVCLVYASYWLPFVIVFRFSHSPNLSYSVGGLIGFSVLVLLFTNRPLAELSAHWDAKLGDADKTEQKYDRLIDSFREEFLSRYPGRSGSGDLGE